MIGVSIMKQWKRHKTKNWPTEEVLTHQWRHVFPLLSWKFRSGFSFKSKSTTSSWFVWIARINGLVWHFWNKNKVIFTFKLFLAKNRLQITFSSSLIGVFASKKQWFQMKYFANSVDGRTSLFNSFHAIGLFLYRPKTSENQWFSAVFRGYRKRPVAWNEIIL